jgi:hypothetical protein
MMTGVETKPEAKLNAPKRTKRTAPLKYWPSMNCGRPGKQHNTIERTAAMTGDMLDALG